MALPGNRWRILHDYDPTTDQTEDEVDHYLRRVEAERLSQEQLTDREADEARVKAPDIV